LDQRAFCSAFDQSNSAEDFSLAVSVPRKVLAALTIAAVEVGEPAVALAVTVVLAVVLALAVALVPVLSEEAQPPVTPASANAIPAATRIDLFRVAFTVPFH
jgi:hypothetical protein